MRTFKVSDDLYEQLKTFVVDPFDDTPEIVIGRLIEIVNKAKIRWHPFDPSGNAEVAEQPAEARSSSAGPPARKSPSSSYNNRINVPSTGSMRWHGSVRSAS